jgi:hypothetical protein
MAIKQGDMAVVKFILEQAGELVTTTSQTVDPNNFFNIESMKHIINNNSFLSLDKEAEEDDEEMLEEEAIEVRDLKLE